MTEPKSLNTPLVATLPHDSVIMLNRWISSGLWLFLAHQGCVQLLWSKNGSLDSIPVKMNLARSLHFFPSYTTHEQLPLDLSVSAHVPPSFLPKLTDFRLADSLARPSFSCSLALAFIWSLHCRPCLSACLSTVASLLCFSWLEDRISVDFYCWSSMQSVSS